MKSFAIIEESFILTNKPSKALIIGSGLIVIGQTGLELADDWKKEAI